MPAVSQRSWRLILSPPMSGPDNMALDEAILESIAGGQAPPTLRLYAWEPPCLSIGYAQPVAQVDRQALRRCGWDLVRRPTGGRAILHTDELTYAVIAPEHGPVFAGGVLPSYHRLSGALAYGLGALGLVVQAEPKPQGIGAAGAGAVCFQVPSAYELTVGGKKLLGSAQLRRRGAALQHGSLPLVGDLGRICQVLHDHNGTGREAARQALLARAATAETLLGRPVSWEAACEALAEGFRQVLQLELLPQTPSSAELEQAVQLRRQRYADPGWTERI